MDELIWRSDAIKAITDEPTDAHYPSWYVDKLKGVPSAEPEIIRCEDCKWCEEHYDIDGLPYWICKNWVGGTDADGFCHEAERKIDE